MTWPGGIGLWVAAFAAGAANAVAGGGTLVTFPTLVALGVPPILANATSTVGLVPGSIGGAFGFREELSRVKRWLPWLVPSSVVGGAAGAMLLLVTPAATFALVIPALVFGATLLFIVDTWRARRTSKRIDAAGSRRGLVVAMFQLVIATYGGYFGAGIGILMLSALSLLGLGDLHEANALKNVAAVCINVVAASIFVARGLVVWRPAVIVIAGALVGGYLGAGFARRLGARRVRVFVIVAGLVAAAVLAKRAYF